MDARRLYLAEGCSSLFTYCTEILHLSEHAAYGRIEAGQWKSRHMALKSASPFSLCRAWQSDRLRQSGIS